MHGMAPHMHMACKEEQEDGDGEVAEGARALMAATPFPAIDSDPVCSLSHSGRLQEQRDRQQRAPRTYRA